MSNRMRFKGFTLIELLAVIIILAIIVLITTPTIINIIKEANEKAFLDTAYSINKAANNYYASSGTGKATVPLLINYSDGKISSQRLGDAKPKPENYLNYTGKHPTSGNVYIDADGNVEMAIYDNRSGICAEKGINDKTPRKTDKNKLDCVLNEKIS